MYVCSYTLSFCSLVLLSSWVLMLADIVMLLCTLVQYSPQLFLPTVAKEKHLNSLFKLLTIANEYSNDQIGIRDYPLFSALSQEYREYTRGRG